MLAFNGATKEITITVVNTLDVKDLWSRWVDWFLTGDNSKYGLAMAQVGGDEIDAVAGTSIPIYIYLLNGWKVKPREANHTLGVTNGILLTDNSTDPFIDTTGAFTVRVNYQQPVQALTVATGGGSGSAPTVTQIADEIMSRDIATETAATANKAAILAAITALDSGSLTNIFTLLGGVATDTDSILLKTIELLKHSKNRWRIATNQLTIYDDDGVTPLQVFNLKDASGSPTMTEPLERVPV